LAAIAEKLKVAATNASTAPAQMIGVPRSRPICGTIEIRMNGSSYQVLTTPKNVF
jgi:hypothetical protein